MNHNPPDNLIEIQDPTIDPDSIMAEVRQRISERYKELNYQYRRFPTFNASVPEEPLDIEYDPNLYHYLHLAHEHYSNVPTQPLLADSPATKIPILGSLWKLIRGSAHNLVLFYVNRVATHQVITNRHLLNTINRLVIQNETQQRAILALQDEIATLKQINEGQA